MSAPWARNCVEQFRHFLKWLGKSPAFDWKRPADLDLPRAAVPLTPLEVSPKAASPGVQTYTPEELRTLWEYATPLQRLFMLLALNCGFGLAEVASLRVGEVHLRCRHPREGEPGGPTSDGDSWVFRVRHKSRVYGEWKLWPETVRAVEWWHRRRAAIPPRRASRRYS